MRLAPLLLILLVLALPAALLAAPGERERAPAPPRKQQPLPPIATTEPLPLPSVVTPTPRPRAKKPSKAAGLPWSGRLVNGRRLPSEGPGYVTWDPIRKHVGNRPWRRWGTGRLLTTLRRVMADYARRHPNAPPVLVGDLSRPHGGDFGPRFGGVGHVSHQNGLDADVYYPRTDGKLRRARRPEQVDRAAAQELVDAFVRAGAEHVFVGPSLDLRGPRRIVEPLVYHDDHLHVRLRGSR